MRDVPQFTKISVPVVYLDGISESAFGQQLTTSYIFSSGHVFAENDRCHLLTNREALSTERTNEIIDRVAGSVPRANFRAFFIRPAPWCSVRCAFIEPGTPVLILSSAQIMKKLFLRRSKAFTRTINRL